ncbi:MULTISPECIES: DUF58 domain-containing protein [Methanoculleus]|uniref:DUF58 domain-containing protein n=2 Tax=Methanoculleus TaxID=45989 RepID=A3CTB5_METMJ|nr:MULTISPECIES: DUF58 domain-containing protein [Methanoculleus]ABN56615.1 protein of unknown function DUF58 [Methanoculleus marisnigri JR1]MCC7555662.1 DUF58 domain-containing protein [Methanoculleus marisnigri]UYU18054.1 DUF58 domain-containing protein [Methanoculleus submarinus]
MIPTGRTSGILALFAAVAAFALFFDDVIGLIATGMLAFFLIYQAFSFNHASGKALAALTVDRSIEARYPGTGVPIGVSSRLTTVLEGGMTLKAEDLPPSLTLIDDPAEDTAYAQGEDGAWISRYTLIPVAPGGARFRGVALTLNNPFFERRGVCRNDVCMAPELKIEPVPSEKDLLTSLRREGQRRGTPRTLLAGQDTRMFRPYQSGDDTRDLDWKLTARYQEYYVRVPELHQEGSPLIIVDLPEQTGPAVSEMHARFLIRVAGAVRRTLNTNDNCSLLLISGGDVKSYHPPLGSRITAGHFLHEIRPEVRNVHQFRTQDTYQLRARARQTTMEADGVAYGNLLGGIYRAFAGARSPDTLDVYLTESLAAAPSGDVHLFTTLEGDTSHITRILLAARSRRRPVYLRVPQGCPEKALTGLEADSLEEI